MEKEKGNFEFVKEQKEDKKNYIFQKDGITKKTTIFIVVVLILLVIAVMLTSMFLNPK
jgi:ABC-type lipoprotein release transport system permease subunit